MTSVRRRKHTRLFFSRFRQSTTRSPLEHLCDSARGPIRWNRLETSCALGRTLSCSCLVKYASRTASALPASMKRRRPRFAPSRANQPAMPSLKISTGKVCAKCTDQNWSLLLIDAQVKCETFRYVNNTQNYTTHHRWESQIDNPCRPNVRGHVHSSHTTRMRYPQPIMFMTKLRIIRVL